MRKITDKKAKTFVDNFCKEIVEIGAKAIKPKSESYRTFELETKAGRLEINIPFEQVHVFTAFSCFDDVERAKQQFGCNPHSGKYNMHVSNTMPAETVAKSMVAVFSSFLPK